MKMPWKRLIGPLQPVAATSGLRDWYRGVCNGAPSTDAFSQAVYGGRLATTPGLAFLAGYQAALRALWPDAPPGLGALCTTERRKLRPADMTTRSENGQLSGSKDFVTTGDAAQWLLVSAREEGAGESPRLGLFVIESTGVGVSLVAGPDLPIVPDIAHGRLSLEQAAGRRLPGDGWSEYVKPFRTHEDLHVLAALTAWLYGIALPEQWPRPLALRLLGVLAAAAEVARQPANEPATHLLLAALLEQFAALQPEVDRALMESQGSWNAMWKRDRAVLGIARDAQTRRLEQAITALAPGCS
ncbi:acyl-CoA dehydrogenase [Pseudomonas kunmingensis]|uniref:acyl-CoA dehydrogenase n=1 Tax=Stutzerimonas kunmingensis TaxID=1211807 RepID=UPI0015E35B2D|nr:acyl-CoA dehydrogenase [Stutzerimonas kunmingensis]MBA1237694.1 acyl-CoA dehydrogenase [Stutzerimonas kunmingensis]MDH2245280.1 acyl-CoA dehydrogenase family protein [Pseudomonas sp. GD03856]MDH2264374.1 acyl-CoA dehydrogenase family protein [Pseudomonas sp. GD03855]